MGQRTRVKLLSGFMIISLFFIVPTASATIPTSNNYRFDETSIGVSNLLESNSANFKATGGAGDTAIGNSGSANFQTEAGSNTTAVPNLTFNMTSSAASFGSFSPASTRTATTTFSVINYTSFGYVVQIAGNPPSYGTNQIDAMTANAASQLGIEQFGINLVANTNPASFGANAQNGTAPNNFGFGVAAPNYATPNQYRYVSGETIAQAPKSSGKTDYTISYIVNVSALTTGGTYGTDQTLIVTGTY